MAKIKENKPNLHNPFFEAKKKKRNKDTKIVEEKDAVIEITFINIDLFMKTITVSYSLYDKDDLMTDQALAGTYKADSTSGQMVFNQSEIDITKPIVEECLELLQVYFE